MNAVRDLAAAGNQGRRRGKPVKDVALIEAFRDRLATAADNNPNVPPMRGGRYEWIMEQLATVGVSISKQAISKWFVAENLPNARKAEALAQVLGVDAGWLLHGSGGDTTKRETRLHNALAAGAVNVLAGLIQMDGGVIAFPDEADKRPVHLDAIIRGARFAFHVALAEETGAGLLFRAPHRRDSVVVLGLVRSEGFAFDVYEIPEEVIEKSGRFSRGMVELLVTDPAATLRPVESFRERL